MSAAAKAAQLFETPLEVKRTFLQFTLYPTVRVRSCSAPPTLQSVAVKQDPPQVKDDDAVLRLGRAQTLRETWQHIAVRLCKAKICEAKAEIDSRKMKLRATLTLGGFAQLRDVIGFSQNDLVQLCHRGIIRVCESAEIVEIWCSDQQQHCQEHLSALISEALALQLLCETSLFLVMPQIKAVLLVCYDEGLTLSALRQKVLELRGLPSEHNVALEHVDGRTVKGKTLRAAGLRRGGSVRAFF